MSGRMIRTAILLMAVALTMSACADYQYRGGATGGAMGGIAGAILDSRNPWRGGVIGAALGSLAGATIADISAQGAKEVVYSGQPVQYTTENGRGRYYAEPIGRNQQTGCTRINERIYEDGRLVRKRIKEICNDEGYDRRDRHERGDRDEWEHRRHDHEDEDDD